MVLQFAFEFIEGNTVTRPYFARLRRLTREALDKGGVTPALLAARGHESLPTFTHFLDIPLVLVIISLGTVPPETWTHTVVGVGISEWLRSFCQSIPAAALREDTILLPRLYPWTPEVSSPD